MLRMSKDWRGKEWKVVTENVWLCVKAKELENKRDQREGDKIRVRVLGKRERTIWTSQWKYVHALF